ANSRAWLITFLCKSGKLSRSRKTCSKVVVILFFEEGHANGIIAVIAYCDRRVPALHDEIANLFLQRAVVAPEPFQLDEISFFWHGVLQILGAELCTADLAFYVFENLEPAALRIQRLASTPEFDAALAKRNALAEGRDRRQVEMGPQPPFANRRPARSSGCKRCMT